MSPVFQKMLEGDFKETITQKIAITDFSNKVVKGFVRYMCYQELSPASLGKNPLELWALADKYEVQVLQNYILDLRSQFVTKANVINLVLRADVHGAKDIKNFCLKFMGTHPKILVEQEEVVRALRQHILADYTMENCRRAE